MTNCCRECGQSLPPPDEMTMWWMYDNHTFARLELPLEKAIQQALAIAATPEGRYGLIGAPKLKYNGKELNRRGPFAAHATVHMGGEKDYAKFVADLGVAAQRWLEDPDVLRLNKAATP